ncbi:hypothetical protein JHK87_053157 [Glycine soja]|nr:hypothetical protein JHK87_053157 [Glycine soja]
MTCKRYWTKGRAFHNVPIGGGCRKNKKVKSSRLSCDSKDSGSSFSELGGLKFLHSLSLSMNFHLGGLPFPRLHHHHPPTTYNHFFSFGDTSNASSCFNLDPSPGTTLSHSFVVVNNNPFLTMVQSKDLHWKLHQQRLAMLFGGDNIQKCGTFAPKSSQLVWYKGQRYVYAHDSKQDPPKLVSGQYSTLLCFALMVVEKPDVVDLDHVTGDLKLCDVSFGYIDDMPLVLNALNLHIRIGEIVVIMGPSGGGKTTLVKLLLRLYDPIYASMICTIVYKHLRLLFTFKTGLKQFKVN